MKKFFILATSVFCLSAYADLEIKGITVDAPADCTLINSMETRAGTFYAACIKKSPQWFTSISFLDGLSDMNITQTPMGMIKSITVTNFNFDKALSSLEAKFGPSKIERSTIQNRMGASFDQVEARWVDGEKHLVLVKHGSQVNKPMLVLYGVEHAIDTKIKQGPSSNL